MGGPPHLPRLADQIAEFEMAHRRLSEAQLAEAAIEIGVGRRRRDEAQIAVTGEVKRGRFTDTGNKKRELPQ